MQLHSVNSETESLETILPFHEIIQALQLIPSLSKLHNI